MFDVGVPLRAFRLPGNLVPVDNLQATAELSDIPPLLFFLRFCATLADSIVGLYAIWQVWMLARSVEESEPFTTKNARRLRLLALIALIGLPIRDAVGTFLTRAVLAAQVPPQNGLVTRFHLSYGPLFAGLCLFVLSEVFARGVDLREDVEGTV
jgi:hypothetical protein